MPTVAAVATFFSVSATTATVLVAVIDIAINFALGKIAQSLSGDAKNFGPAPQTVTVRGTIEPRRIIYGEVRTAGVVTYIGTTGSDNEYLWYVIALAGHQCESISDVWLGSEKIASANIASDGRVTAGRFANKVYIWRKLGSSAETVVPELADATTDISGDHIGYGVTKLVIRMERDSTAFPGGAPQEFFALVKGKRVYDPRKDSTNGGSGSHRLNDATTWEWSANPALCTADYAHGGSILFDEATPIARLGMGLSTDRVNWTYASAAANECDELVNIPGSKTQKRYELGLVLSCGEIHDVNMDKLLATMIGQRIFVGGKLRIYAGVYDAPTASIDDDDLSIDGYSYQGAASENELYNQVSGTYYDPLRDWQQQPCVVRTESVYEAEDGRPILRNITLDGVTDEYRAQRICEVIKKQSRNQASVVFNCKLSADKIAPWETFTASIAEQGWVNKVFRAQAIEFDIGARRVQITAKEEDSTCYNDPAVEDYAARGTAAPSSTVERPSAPSALQANGVQDGILFTFTPSAFLPPGAKYELYEHTTANGFASATKVADGLSATPIFLRKSDTTTRYYWILARSFEGQASDRHPIGNGISGQASAVSAIFSVSASPASLTDEDTTASITTPSTTVTASNGTPPYTYAWTWDSGGSGITIDSSSAATTTFSATGLTVGTTRTGQAKCTVTDNSSASKTTTVSVTISRVSTALSATVSPSSIVKTSGASSITTGSATVTAVRGTPSYSYAWTWLSGGSGITINSPSSATTSFTATSMGSGAERSGTARCTVTDSASDTVTVDVSVSIIRTGTS